MNANSPSPTTLPFSVRTQTWGSSSPPEALLGTGKNITHYQPPAGKGEYWIMAINRTTLKADYNVIQESNIATPTGISPYLNSGYFLVICTKAVSTLNLPQGPFFKWIDQYGGGRKLRRMVSIGEQFGCGAFGHLNYCMVNTLSDSKVAESNALGFEELNGDGSQGLAVLTISLQETTLPDGSSIWTPIALKD